MVTRAFLERPDGPEPTGSQRQAVRNRWILGWVAAGLTAFSAANAQVSAGLQDVRRHLLDANVNVLTFHSIEYMFTTRRVETSSTPWALPREEMKLDFTYEYGG